jgi:hypothetical protein
MPLHQFGESRMGARLGVTAEQLGIGGHRSFNLYHPVDKEPNKETADDRLRRYVRAPLSENGTRIRAAYGAKARPHVNTCGYGRPGLYGAAARGD